MPRAWRAPNVDAANYVNIDANIRYAQAAERGKFAFLFTPDFPAVRENVEQTTLSNTMDPMISLTAISQATSRIGFVATGSTTFQEPFNHARQFKALDVLSHGRAGWNAVTTSDPAMAANYGQPVAARAERAHEFIQIVQALWGSWEKDAWIKDQASGRFIDPSRLQPINLQGKPVASRGPLGIPPSEQGQPFIFTSGGPSPHLLSVAGRYASGFIAEVWTIEEARAQRALVRQAAEQAGRDPDEIKCIVGLMTTVAPTVREGLDRRIAIAGDMLDAQVPHLSAMLGVPLQRSQLGQPLTPQQLAAAQATGHPRSAPALEVARQGWTIRDILAEASTTTPSPSVPPTCMPTTSRSRSRQAPPTGSGSAQTSTRTASTHSPIRSYRCCRSGASTPPTTQDEPCGRTSACPSSTAWTRASPATMAEPGHVSVGASSIAAGT